MASALSMPSWSIPACAGEPLDRISTLDRAEVYPRVCGGTPPIGVRTGRTGGLSPRVRGNLERGCTAIADAGSIPACAGEPSVGCGRASVVWVYPRVCGGTVEVNKLRPDMVGLSPRVRGNLVRVSKPRTDCGSIPACAGEPLLRGSRSDGCEVYPRVCGGTKDMSDYLLNVKGLSPRVRGNPVRRPPLRSRRRRSIPACAGEPGLLCAP